jgi:ribonuclease HII
MSNKADDGSGTISPAKVIAGTSPRIASGPVNVTVPDSDPTISESLAAEIRTRALAWSVAAAEVHEIDSLNILAATLLAMQRAVLGLVVKPAAMLVDGNQLPSVEIDGRRVPGEAIVRGDARIASISAASIIAKTARDAIMVKMDEQFPDYAFAQHKGYGTRLHLERLRQHGPCIQHRRSFAPVRRAG